MKRNLFTCTSLLALLLLVAASVPALAQTPEERPGSSVINSPALYEMAEAAEREDAERNKLLSFLESFWNDAFGEEYSPGESSLLFRETGDPRYWQVLVAHSGRSTNENLGLAFGTFEEVQRLPLSRLSDKVGPECQKARSQNLEIERYLVVGTMVGSTGRELVTWGIVATAGDALRDIGGTQLRVFSPGGTADDLEEATYQAEVMAGTADTKPGFGGLLDSGPTEKSWCEINCESVYGLALYLCDQQFIGCVEDVEQEGTQCAIECTADCEDPETTEEECEACFAACLTDFNNGLLSCAATQATCYTIAAVARSFCLKECRFQP